MIVKVAAVVMTAAVAAAVASAVVDVPVGLLTDEPVNWNVQKQLLIELNLHYHQTERSS